MKKQLLFTLIWVLALVACSKIEQPLESPPKNSEGITPKSEFLISPTTKTLVADDAKNVAKRFSELSFDKVLQPTVNATRGADQFETIKSDDGEVIAYVVNFDGGGFCLIGAVKELYPILAHSDKGSFDVESIDKSGVSIWVSMLVESYGAIDELTEDELFALKQIWADYEDETEFVTKDAATRSSSSMNDAFNKKFSEFAAETGRTAFPLSASSMFPSGAYSTLKGLAMRFSSPEQFTIIEVIKEEVNISVGPLVTTSWHQEYPFNRAIHIDNVFAGCVAIAMGQIMNYHQHPAGYSWSTISNNKYSEAARLIADIGRNVNMDYGVIGVDTGSGSNIYKANTGFQKMGYNSTISTSVNIRTEVATNRRPIYIRGSKAGANTGHAWVLSGYKERYITGYTYKMYAIHGSNGNYYYSNSSDMSISHFVNSVQSKVYHHNWGWGDSSDGWYSTLVPLSYTTQTQFLTASPRR